MAKKRKKVVPVAKKGGPKFGTPAFQAKYGKGKRGGGGKSKK